MDNELEFDFYKWSDLKADARERINSEDSKKRLKMAGLARQTVVKHSKTLEIDFNDKQTAKGYIKDTKEFYTKTLN